MRSKLGVAALLLVSGGLGFWIGRKTKTPEERGRVDRDTGEPPAVRLARDMENYCRISRPLTQEIQRRGADGSFSAADYMALVNSARPLFG